MRILLTGHNGYIGSIMTKVLEQAGHTVIGLDSYYYEDCVLGKAGSDITALHKDVRDVAPQDLKGFDAVVHLAALSNDPLGELNPDWTYDINYRASVKLAQAAKDAGVKLFLYSSSCSMYGAAGDDMLTEEAPLRPITHYAVSKVRTEEDVTRLADRDFSPVFLRNSTAYGISPRLRADLVLNNLVGWAFTTGQVRIMSDGTPWRPIIHIEDLSLAAAAVLAAPREVVHAQAFNVGLEGENYQVRDLARIVEETVPNCRIEYAGQGGPDPRNYRVDFGKLRKLIPGFRPKWNARMGAKEIYEAFRRAKLTEEEFVGRKYTRVRQLKHLVDEGLVDETLRWKRMQS